MRAIQNQPLLSKACEDEEAFITLSFFSEEAWLQRRVNKLGRSFPIFLVC